MQVFGASASFFFSVRLYLKFLCYSEDLCIQYDMTSVMATLTDLTIPAQQGDNNLTSQTIGNTVCSGRVWKSEDVRSKMFYLKVSMANTNSKDENGNKTTFSKETSRQKWPSWDTFLICKFFQPPSIQVTCPLSQLCIEGESCCAKSLCPAASSSEIETGRIFEEKSSFFDECIFKKKWRRDLLQPLYCCL